MYAVAFAILLSTFSDVTAHSQVSQAANQALALRLEQMSHAEQLEDYFGAVPASARGSVRRAATAYSVDRFASDPALESFEGIRAAWLVSGSSRAASAEDLVESKIMVARNLFLRGGQTPTAAAVELEVQRLRRTRERWAGTHLFRGRSVVYAASDDTMQDGRGQFGRLANQVAMRREAASYYFFRGDERVAPAGRRADFEQALAAEPSLTFVFEGHGRADALKFDGKLTVRELARLLARRPAHYPAAIVILDACQSHTFGRRLLEELDRRHPEATKPIVIVPDEYGQNLVKDVFNDSFLRLELAGTKDATIESALRSGSRRMSIYVPDDQAVPMQIG